MNELTYNKTFKEWEGELNTELTRSAESFVRIGYLLKVARDTEILKDSGYANINDYARDRYNIDKTMVSRFINIHERFGENGELKDQYKGFGYAKLAIMLQIPEEITEELTPDYTKTEISTIKSELDEEAKVSDIEMLIEGRDRNLDEMTPMEQVLYKICEDEATFNRLFTAIEDGLGKDGVKNALAPAGDAIYSIRLQGIGRISAIFKKDREEVALVSLRTGEKELHTLDDVLAAAGSLFDGEDRKTCWKRLMGKEPDEKAEVAPVQPRKVTPAKVETDEKQQETDERQQEETNRDVVPEVETNRGVVETTTDTDEQKEPQEEVTPDTDGQPRTEPDKPDFETEMAAVLETRVIKEELKKDIIITTLDIVNTLQGSMEPNEEMLERLIETSENLTQKLLELKEMYG